MHYIQKKQTNKQKFNISSPERKMKNGLKETCIHFNEITCSINLIEHDITTAIKNSLNGF